MIAGKWLLKIEYWKFIARNCLLETDCLELNATDLTVCNCLQSHKLSQTMYSSGNRWTIASKCTWKLSKSLLGQSGTYESESCFILITNIFLHNFPKMYHISVLLKQDKNNFGAPIVDTLFSSVHLFVHPFALDQIFFFGMREWICFSFKFVQSK